MSVFPPIVSWLQNTTRNATDRQCDEGEQKPHFDVSRNKLTFFFNKNYAQSKTVAVNVLIRIEFILVFILNATLENKQQLLLLIDIIDGSTSIQR